MTSPFNPLGTLRVLNAHHVDYVLIGGLAARLWGSPSLTNDLDICYSRSATNLERLATALHELGAQLRGVEEDVPFVLDAETIAAGDSFTFTTTMGNLDILATPSGTQGYPDVAAAATLMELGDLEVRVCDVEDLMRMKEAAGRPKDLIELEVLGALREELDRG